MRTDSEFQNSVETEFSAIAGGSLHSSCCSFEVDEAFVLSGKADTSSTQLSENDTHFDSSTTSRADTDTLSKALVLNEDVSSERVASSYRPPLFAAALAVIARRMIASQWPRRNESVSSCICVPIESSGTDGVIVPFDYRPSQSAQ